MGEAVVIPEGDAKCFLSELLEDLKQTEEAMYLAGMPDGSMPVEDWQISIDKIRMNLCAYVILPVEELLKGNTLL